MAPPPVQLFLTTIASQITLRQRQEYILRALQVKKIPYTSFDLASDEDAKRLWKRKAPLGETICNMSLLPGILVGEKFVGFDIMMSYSTVVLIPPILSEEAVEFNELEIFLRQNEDWKPPEDERARLVAKPVGVPGAYEPLQMFPKHAPSRSPSPNPMSLREKEKKELDMSTDLGEFGLEGVSVSADDLRALVEELGLGGDDANELVKGLAVDVPESKSQPVKAEAKKEKTEEKAKEKEKTEEKAKEKVEAEEKEKVKAEEEAEHKVKAKEKAEENIQETKNEEVKPTPAIKVESNDAHTAAKEDAGEQESKMEDTKITTARKAAKEAGSQP
ncbi:hypothetical protein EIP86_011290 [Pleurotus ostreatoroseus]|nr:hypothetical protein EIP86_011290 [Pleurotus ostreatoroseus]